MKKGGCNYFKMSHNEGKWYLFKEIYGGKTTNESMIRFFSVTERWAGNANEHLWSTRRDAWFHAACASALLADSHVNLCFTGIFPLPCLIKYFLLLYMRFFFMLEELCFVFFSSISTIDFAPIFGIQYKARSMGIVFPNKIYKIIANHKCFL